MFQMATAKHIDGILGLMREFYLAEGYLLSETAAHSALKVFLGNPELGELWVAAEGDQVVAYVAVTFGFSFEFGGRDAFIDELVMAPSHQGQGLGTKALAVAEAVCRTAGVRALHLEVERGKDHARRLYEKIRLRRALAVPAHEASRVRNRNEITTPLPGSFAPASRERKVACPIHSFS